MTATATPPSTAPETPAPTAQQRVRQVIAFTRSRWRPVLVGGFLVVLVLALAYVSGQDSAAADARADRAVLSDQLDDLRSEVATAEERAEDAEDELASVRTAAAARNVQLGVRLDELDAREAAITTRETAATAVEQAVADAQIPGGGTYVVGEDVAAGTYKSEDNDGCYYAFMDGTGSDADIIDNNIGDGLMRVTLKDGDIFETNRCNLWVPA